MSDRWVDRGQLMATIKLCETCCHSRGGGDQGSYIGRLLSEINRWSVLPCMLLVVYK